VKKKAVETNLVATPTNPFSLGIKANGFLFVSGQVGKDSSGKMVEGFEPQVRQTMENLKAIITAAGAEMDDAVKLTIYVTDISRIGQMNAIYREYFSEPLPARATVEVSKLGLTAEIEIDAIVLVE
jgi:2-iminobutanoate/2-iminopropanoate deaminase